MPRRVEDIVRNDKRSVRNIPADKGRESELKKARPLASSESEIERPRSRDKIQEIPIHRMKVMPEPPKDSVDAKTKAPKKRGGKVWLWSALAIVITVIGSGYIASAYFSRATFTIIPITIPVTASNATIVATGTSTPGYLRYETTKYTGSASSTVLAEDGPLQSSKATGSIIIYNKYSAEPQRLIAGTRFSNSSGLIYRLPSSVVIPGYTDKDGEITAGSVRTTVIADQPGQQYNLGVNEYGGILKAVAYNGGPRYDTIYAQLRTEISGGFEGRKKTVSPQVLASTTEILQNSLKDALISQARSKVTGDDIMYPSSYAISFTKPTVGGAQANAASVSVTATLYAITFKKTDLVAKLAGKTKMDTLGDGDYSAPGLENLDFAITNMSNFAPDKGGALIARMNGSFNIVGSVPIDELKSKLAGLSLAETKNVIGSYSSVIDVPKSSGELFPSWATSVPSDIGRISIIIKD